MLPPIYGSNGKVSVGSTAVVIDMTTWPQTACLPTTTVKGSEHLNPLGQYVSLEVEPGGVTCYCVFADTYAHAAAISATSTTTVAANTGVVTIAGTEGFPLGAGQFYNFRPPPGPSTDSTGKTVKWGTQSTARYLGLITASSSVNVSIYVSSR